jgi:7-cyano-7-deazaguanine synthase
MFHRQNAVILLSGGLDSTVALAKAVQEYEVVLALTFNYGQRAFGKEVKASRLVAEHYRVKHEIIALPWLSSLLPKNLVMRRNGQEPVVPMDWMKGSIDDAFFDAKPVWVPNRNGLFLNIAATYAEALEDSIILFGANAEEAERFPDNTPEFRDRINAAFELSTLNHPEVVCPVGDLNKTEIVDAAVELDVPLHLIWSCYTDADVQCGQCPSCFRLKQALHRSKSGATYLKRMVFAD